MNAISKIFAILVILGGFLGCVSNSIVGMLVILAGLILICSISIVESINLNHENLKNMLKEIYNKQ